MKYATYEALKRGASANAGITADLLGFDNALAGEYQNDPLGVSILRTCLLTPQLATLPGLAEDQINPALADMAQCLREEHGLKPYAAEWAVNAWCSALGRHGYFNDLEYLNSLDDLSVSECIALAERHDAPAAYSLAYRYSLGENGVSQVNEAEARRWEKFGAELMHSGCTCFYLMDLEVDEKYDEAFQVATRVYGFCPDPQLLGALGEYYFKGWGCEQNEARALSLFQEGGRAGDNRSIWGVGLCKLLGAGCEKDIPAAYALFQEAARNGHGPSARNVYLMISEKHVDVSAGEAFLACERAVQKGYTEFTHDLAMMYIKGEGIEADPAKAVAMLQEAAERGDAASMGLLGRCLLNGTGVRANPREGIRWLEKGAENDDLTSCLLMCRIALTGTKEYPMHKGKGFQYAAQARELGAEEEDLPEEARKTQKSSSAGEKLQIPGDSQGMIKFITNHASPIEWRAAGKAFNCTAAYVKGLHALGENCPAFERRWFYYLTMMAMVEEVGHRFDEDSTFLAAALNCLEVMAPNVIDGMSVKELVDEYFELQEKLETDEDMIPNGVITLLEACEHERVLNDAAHMAYGHIMDACKAVANM